MKKIKGLALRRLGIESVIVAESLDLIDFDRLVSLNESAAYIWESLPDFQAETNSDTDTNSDADTDTEANPQASDSDFDLETVTRLLTARYDVEEATARQDAQELIATWLKAGIITP